MRAHCRSMLDGDAARGRVRREPCLALSSRRRSGIRAMSEAPLLEVSSIVKTYRVAGVGPFARKNARPALAGVSFSMQQGRSFGVVGESGSGKSALARIALALDKPDSGVVRLQGHSLFDLPRRELRAARPHICETTAVMYRGRIVEIGETDALFAHPAHPYTRELVDATPRLDQPTRAPLAPANGGP